MLPALLAVIKLQAGPAGPKPYTLCDNPHLVPGCRSSSSLYANNSLSVAASALWRLPLVYLVLNFIRIAAVMGKLLSNRSATFQQFSATFEYLFSSFQQISTNFAATAESACNTSHCQTCLQHQVSNSITTAAILSEQL